MAALLNKEHVDGVLARYRGTALGMRMLALHGSLSGELQRAALTAALAKMAQGVPVGAAPVWNTGLYSTLHARLAASHADTPKLDSAWVSATEAKMAARQQELERDAAQAVSCNIRDTVRRVHLEYAQFLAERGELLKAMHAAMKARENCADPSQSAAVVASLVEWACLLKEWNWVSGNLSRAEFSGHLTAGAEAKLSAAQGLFELQGCFFARAAAALSGLTAAATDFAPLHPEDAGLLALACGMAVLKRSELRALAERSACKLALDASPHLRAALEAQTAGRFREAQGAYADLCALLRTDPYAHAATPALTAAHRAACLRQYAAPFSCVPLARALEALGSAGSSSSSSSSAGGGGSSSSSSSEGAAALEALEGEFAALIQAGHLAARLSAVDKTLSAFAPSQRSRAVASVRAAAERYQRSAAELLLRVALDRYGLSVGLAGAGGGGGARGRGGAGRAAGAGGAGGAGPAGAGGSGSGSGSGSGGAVGAEGAGAGAGGMDEEQAGAEDEGGLGHGAEEGEEEEEEEAGEDEDEDGGMLGGGGSLLRAHREEAAGLDGEAALPAIGALALAAALGAAGGSGSGEPGGGGEALAAQLAKVRFADEGLLEGLGLAGRDFLAGSALERALVPQARAAAAP